jgi:ABC-type branched-subunit amino acid transport system ATPase component
VLQFGQKIFDGLPNDLVNDARVVNAYLGTAGMGE